MFWRVHWPDLPPFNRDNAWSRPWGEYGTGKALYGYSAMETPTDLVRYFNRHGSGIGDTLPIVVFEGLIVGVGPDREPLVLPSQTIAWIRGSDLDRGLLEHEDDEVKLRVLLKELGRKRRLR